MRRVDAAGVLIDLRGRLATDGRTSWGRPQLLQLLAELEAANTVDVTGEDAMMHRVLGAVADTLERQDQT